MKTSDFYFDLPEELIAQTPLEKRDASRLLCLDKVTGEIQHRVFSELPELLRPGDCLVMNDSRVLPARLLGVRKPTVHNTLAALKQRGMIDKERYGDVRLTAEGAELARELERQRDELTLLACRLGLEPGEGAQFAALLLSGLSQQGIERLCAAQCRAQRALT